MALTVAQQRQPKDAQLRALREAEAERDAEIEAAVVRGERRPDEKAPKGAVSSDWLKKLSAPREMPRAVRPYFGRLKKWLPEGIAPEDAPIVIALAAAMHAVDHHGGLAIESEDWKDHAAARDRAIERVERFHKQLQSACARRLIANPPAGDPEDSGVLVGKFR